MWEVVKAFAFFGLGLTLSGVYHALAWRRYQEGRSEAGRRPDAEVHSRRFPA